MKDNIKVQAPMDNFRDFVGRECNYEIYNNCLTSWVPWEWSTSCFHCLIFSREKVS
jgi:hypothetical protein